MGASHEFQVRNSALILHKVEKQNQRSTCTSIITHTESGLPVILLLHRADSHSRLMIYLKVRRGGLLLDDSTHTQFRTGAKGKAVLSPTVSLDTLSTQLCYRW
jgi:hypothetical protein